MVIRRQRTPILASSRARKGPFSSVISARRSSLPVTTMTASGLVALPTAVGTLLGLVPFRLVAMVGPLLATAASLITAFVFSDTLDGTMARLSGRSSPWGAFLDSTLDRVADASVFGALLLWFAGRGDEPLLAAGTLGCLIGGAVVAYAKARAEGLGLTANGGIAERSERLVLVLATTGLSGLFHAPWLQAAG